MVTFTPIKTSVLPIFHNENYRLLSCYNGHIVFSYAQKGNALTIHFASDKIGLRRVRKAANAICKMLFSGYDWLEMIYAVIEKDKSGVKKIARRCGFNECGHDKGHDIFVRMR